MKGDKEMLPYQISNIFSTKTHFCFKLKLNQLNLAFYEAIFSTISFIFSILMGKGLGGGINLVPKQVFQCKNCGCVFSTDKEETLNSCLTEIRI